MAPRHITASIVLAALCAGCHSARPQQPRPQPPSAGDTDEADGVGTSPSADGVGTSPSAPAR
jgi:mono/diheme cytochrome c family protein